jgi:hypothetical protein
LENAAGLLHRGAEQDTFRVGHRHRLLKVDVLAREHGGERRFGMPMVGRADHDGVDVGAGEQLPIVAVNVDALHRQFLFAIKLLREGAPVRGPLGVDIAHGDIVAEPGMKHAGHVVALRDPPAANLADANAIARSVCAEEACRD